MHVGKGTPDNEMLANETLQMGFNTNHRINSSTKSTRRTPTKRTVFEGLNTQLQTSQTDHSMMTAL